MRDIRNLLSQGRSSTEVIALGYKPPTVYKVQRQFRWQQPNGMAPSQEVDQGQVMSDREGQEELSDEAAEDFWGLFNPAAKPNRFEVLQEELSQARDRIKELERQVKEAEKLKARLKELEAQAQSVGALQWQVWGLEQDLKRSSHLQGELSQSNAQWEKKFREERSAREQIERQARRYREQASLWQEAHQVVNSKLEASVREASKLRAELQNLEPLRAWAGHPCCVCGKPMTGSVSRELAAKLQQGMRHKRCMQAQSSGLGKVLLAGSTLWGLSQLGKRK
jgi:DNA repair exonuclease SbcCD ATPase subunit